MYVKCIEIGDGAIRSVFSELPGQIIDACDGIRNDPIFNSQPVNIIGFS